MPQLRLTLCLSKTAMIKTVADFLYKLQEQQEKIAEANGIEHRVTIGEMYENIAAGLLDKALFEGLDINIVSQSFIIDENKHRSNELDIIIIDGKGIPISFTDRYDVKFEQVIAVIQVKKTLNIQQLEEGYLNLYSVYEIAPEGMQDYQAKMFNDMYRSICRESAAVNGRLRRKFASGTAEGLYEILKWEAILPGRILFAFNGYQTEKGLRDSFFNFLVKKRSTPVEMIPGFGPINFPNLIVNDDFMLIKNNGAPYVAPLSGVDWNFYTSSRGNPFLALLEIIWTRLSYRYHLPSSIFGEDLQMEGSNAFLSANSVIVDGMRGWNYHYTGLREFTLAEHANDSLDWSPVQLTFEQFHILNYLCKYEFIKLHRIRRVLSLGEDEVFDVDSLIQFLKNADLVYIYADKELRLLTQKCQTLIMPDGNYYAADNKTGRLTRWSEKNLGKTK